MTSQLDHDPDAHGLVDRLNAGWLMIDCAPDPERRARLEDHWTELLRQYEAICDDVDHHRERKADDRLAVEVRHGD